MSESMHAIRSPIPLRPLAPSVAAALALHGAVTWAVLTWRDEPSVVVASPMQVRMVSVSNAQRQSAPLARQASSRTAQAAATPAAAPQQVPTPAPAPTPTPAKAVPKPEPARAAAPQPAPQASPTPAPQPAPAPPVAQAHTPAPAVAAPTPAVALPASPTAQTSVTVAAAAPVTDAPRAPVADKAGSGGRDPIELPSSSVAYLVQPVLTFPDGDDQGEYGTVTLSLLIDEKGRAIEVRTLTSSGYARLDQHGARVIRRALFKPQIVNGEPRKVWTSVKLHFNPPKP